MRTNARIPRAAWVAEEDGHVDCVVARVATRRPVILQRVTIVSRQPETREALRGYLGESGLDACALDSADVQRVARDASAVVLFPDDFPEGHARAFAEGIRRAQPSLLLIVVTREPQRFTASLSDRWNEVAPLILPRPSFGWSILDAIRAHSARRREAR